MALQEASGRADCYSCNKKIEKGEKAVSEYYDYMGHSAVRWYHAYHYLSKLEREQIHLSREIDDLRQELFRDQK